VPTFPTENQLFGVLQGELPPGLYSDDTANNENPANNAWTSSEVRAWALLFVDLYSSLLAIWNNKFVTLADASGIQRWEIMLFGAPQSATLTLTQRRNALLAQLQYQGGINYAIIYAATYALLNPLGFAFGIQTYNGARPGSSWILNSSLLGLDTYLAPCDPIKGTGGTPLNCSLDYEAAGITTAQLASIQSTAYTYVVKITGTATDATIAQLNTLLTKFEGASRTHQVVNNFQGPYLDSIDGGCWDTDPVPATIIDCGPFSISSRAFQIGGGTW
jgi:hypothetical protein